jgi:hypothetical protein
VSQQVSLPVREVGLERSEPPACDNDNNDNDDDDSDNNDKGARPTLHFAHPSCQAHFFYLTVTVKLFFASLHSFSQSWPISSVHPIMIEKPLAGEGGGGGGARHAPPFSLLRTITYKVAVYAPAERADTLSLFHLHPLWTLWFQW